MKSMGAPSWLFLDATLSFAPVTRPSFPLEMTTEEEDFGFGVTLEPSGVRAVVRELRSGLQAVKVLAEDGATEYAICDAQFRPIYPPAKTLDELRAHCRELIAYFKAPERLAIVDHIPYSAIGKVNREQLATLIAEDG